MVCGICGKEVKNYKQLIRCIEKDNKIAKQEMRDLAGKILDGESENYDIEALADLVLKVV